MRCIDRMSTRSCFILRDAFRTSYLPQYGYNSSKEVAAMSVVWTIIYALLIIIAILILLPILGVVFLVEALDVLLIIGGILLIVAVLHWIGLF